MSAAVSLMVAESGSFACVYVHAHTRLYLWEGAGGSCDEVVYTSSPTWQHKRLLFLFD